MSAFRPKVGKLRDARYVTAAYEERSIARMIANGSTEEHAHAVMAERHRRREARRAEQQDSLPTSAG